MKLNNKIVVITGVSKGIGKACALEFIKKGAIVYGIDIDEENGKKLENSIPNNFTFIKADISKEEKIEKAKNIILKEKNGIDVLINNAARQTVANFWNTRIEDFRKVIECNLIGTFICSSVLGKEINTGGKIINMLSVHSKIVRKDKYAYDASKAGIEMLTKEMALDFADRNINVLGISYGACNTPMNNDWINNIEKKKETMKKIPIKWIAEPEEIAKFVLVILEIFSDYTTGNVFTIDGGRSLIG